ncbi:MAG: 1-acyl-sn-glycerol-3-phosphate acyltransferase [Bacteroidetes bacterium]|nr:1-acyl-sn-glycerol-3-phosphate acyltransferase [Bacteroidota bacterium]
MRIIITGIRLLLIAVSCVFFSTAALVSLLFQRNGGIYFWAGSTWSKFVLWVSGVKVRAEGLETLDRAGNFIIVSNHASVYDIPTLMTLFPRMRIMFKKELSYIPIWGWALKYGHHILVDRKKGTEAMKSLDRAARAIGEGGQVLLFAEGTRTRNGELQPFKRGAFSLAAKSGAPILPAAINGSFSILPKGSFDIRPAKITAVFGELLQTSNVKTREEEIQLMNAVRAVIEKNYHSA